MIQELNIIKRNCLIQILLLLYILQPKARGVLFEGLNWGNRIATWLFYVSV